MIADMRLAAREDRDKNAQKIPATKKISMLPSKLNIFLVKSLGAKQEIKSFNEFYFPGSYRLWSRGGYDPGPAGCAMPRTGHRVPKGRHPPRDQPAGPRLVAGPPGWGRRPDLGRPDTLQELPVQEGGHEAHHCSRRPLWRKRKWRPLK